MKTKVLLTTTLLFAGFFIGSAQTETRLGAMIAYGTEVENVGIGVNAEFPIMEKLTVSPNFIYYLPKDEYGANLNWWELNGNLHYYFTSTENMGFYGIGGINYSHVSFDFENNSGFGDSSINSSDGRIGLNLGAGANFNIDSGITPFAEAKYVIIDGAQLVLAAGIKFNL